MAETADLRPGRDVIIGRNSKVWRAASMDARVRARFTVAIGHSEVATFPFQATDRVWIFSYSRDPAQNTRLLAKVAQAGVREVIYITSATTNIVSLTRCYEYPRVKFQAEQDARRIANARIVSLGLVVDSEDEVPAGRSAVTLQSRINEFLLQPHWPARLDTPTLLFSMISRPFAGPWERLLYAGYGAVQWRLRRWPCTLRPVDVLLRAMGLRWYGYVCLSNRLWNMTI